jgi:hypothetical protein
VETDPGKTQAAVVTVPVGEQDRPLAVVAFSLSEGCARNVSETSACQASGNIGEKPDLRHRRDALLIVHRNVSGPETPVHRAAFYRKVSRSPAP